MRNEQEIIDRYLSGESTQKLAIELNLPSYRTVYKILKKNNIKPIRNIGIDEEKFLLLYNNGITGAKKLSEIFDVPKANIKYYLKKFNLKSISNIRTLDVDFFEKIDTEEKAYFLGLMYADGCIYKNKRKQ